MKIGFKRPPKPAPINKRGALVVKNLTRQTVLVDGGTIADNPVTRTRGLLYHTHLEPGDGLWINPCSSIHSFGMKFVFDALFLDRDRKVIHVIQRMKPWEISYQFMPLCGIGVLEMPSGTIENTQTQKGDQMEFSVKST